jgi:hypothetical protein
VRSATWRLPRIVAVATAANDARIVAMERLRWRVATALFLIIGLAALLLVSRVVSHLGLFSHA